MITTSIIKNKYFIALSLGVAIVLSVAIAACKGVSAQSIETLTGQPKVANPQIKIGSNPEAIAVNQATNKVYAYDPKNGTVSIINSNTGSTVKNIRVGKHTTLVTQAGNPIGIDYRSNKVYVANADSNTVSVIDGDNDTVIAQIKVGESPFTIATGDFHKVYVGNDNNSFSVIDDDNDKKIYNEVVNGLSCIRYAASTEMFYVGNESGRNYGTVLVIDASNDTIIKRIKVGKDPCPILVEEIPVNKTIQYMHITLNSHKDLRGKWGSNTLSVINGVTNTNTGKDIPVGKQPMSMMSVGDKIYVANADSNATSVVNPRDDTNEQNITLGFPQYKIAGDYYSHKIYFPNQDSNTVSVIDGNSTGVPYKKDLRDIVHDIVVGQGPKSISFNAETHMIYIGNSESNTISVINGFTSKVAAGVTFNVHPGNSGTIWCGNQEYPTNTYMYVDNGTSCRGQGKNNFEFDGWVQNTGRNSTLPVGGPSEDLTVNRYGTFTANFKPLPPPIPPEYLAPLYAIVASSLVGWSIPTIYGWYKSRKQLEHLQECMNQIGKLDKNTIEDKINGYYVHGKISQDHRQFLADKVAEYYDSKEK